MDPHVWHKDFKINVVRGGLIRAAGIVWETVHVLRYYS